MAFFFIAFLAQLPLLIAQLTPVPGFLFLLPILIIAGIFLNTLGAGAAALAVAWQYLGREISVGACYRRAWNRVLSLLGTSIVYTIALALPFVTIIGIPLSFYLLVRWFFYTQAIMVENKTGPKESLRRSHELVPGKLGRVFGIGITFLIMLLVLSLVAGIPGAIATISSPITGTLLSYIGGL